MSAVLVLMAALASQSPPITPPELDGPEPQVDAPALRRGQQRTVSIRLTVLSDGTVGDIEVLGAVEAPLAQAVIAAVRQVRFRPARQGDAPVAVRIRWTLQVGEVPSSLGRDRRPPAELSRRGGARVTGRVLARGSRQPLIGVPILIPELGREAVTDADGRFVLDGLPTRRLRLVVPALDTDGVERRVVPPALDLVLRVQLRRDRRYETIVRQPPQDPVRRVVAVERAREVPGSGGDPVKVVESLPGVGRGPTAGPGAGGLVVRGSAPEDTKNVLDGMPLPQLYHFGNIYSVIQDPFLGAVVLRSGGFSSEFGDATGGLLEVTLAPLRSDGWHGHVDINVYHAAALVSGPLGKGWTIGAAFRRSWVDAFLGAVLDGSGVSLVVAPRYYDYQVRADWRPNERLSLRLIAFGSDDDVATLSDEPSAADPTSRGFSLRRYFHQLQARLDAGLAPGLTLSAGLSVAYQRILLAPTSATSLDIAADPLVARLDLDWRISPTLRLRGGLSAQVQRFNVRADVPAPAKEGQSAAGASQDRIREVNSGFGGALSPWVELTWEPQRALSLVAGFRLQGWLGAYQAIAPDPRLAFRWDIVPGTTLSAAVGLYHQAPAPDESAPRGGNPDLLPERALQASLGLRQRAGDLITIEVQGFYKLLDQLVAPGDLRAGEPRYRSTGTGDVIGAELLVRLDWTWLDGWIAYTVSRSRRRDRAGAALRPFSYDQTHVLTVVLGVNPGAGWRIGTRLRYATGNPYTPLGPAYFDAGADRWVPRETASPLSRRLEDFIALDVRVDKKFTFDTWELTAYVEVSNATNRQNVEAVGYTYDYRTRRDTNSLPILPAIGIRGSF